MLRRFGEVKPGTPCKPPRLFQPSFTVFCSSPQQDTVTHSQAGFWALPWLQGHVVECHGLSFPFEIHLQQLSWTGQGQTKCFAHGVASGEFCSAPSSQGRFVPENHPGYVQQRIQGSHTPAVGGWTDRLSTPKPEGRTEFDSKEWLLREEQALP